MESTVGECQRPREPVIESLSSVGERVAVIKMEQKSSDLVIAKPFCATVVHIVYRTGIDVRLIDWFVRRLNLMADPTFAPVVQPIRPLFASVFIDSDEKYDVFVLKRLESLGIVWNRWESFEISNRYSKRYKFFRSQYSWLCKHWRPTHLDVSAIAMVTCNESLLECLLSLIWMSVSFALLHIQSRTEQSQCCAVQSNATLF